MAYFESITAGRGGLDSFNQALNNQRYANLVLNESMGNFANTIANAGSLFDNAKIREEALKYQKMRDLSNDKKQAQSFDLQKRQAEQSMDFAKRRQVMNEEMHKQNKRLNELKTQALAQENWFNKQQQDWIMKATPNAQVSALVGNEAKPTTAPNPLNTQSPSKTITKEELKQYISSNPFFRY